MHECSNISVGLSLFLDLVPCFTNRDKTNWMLHDDSFVSCSESKFSVRSHMLFDAIVQWKSMRNVNFTKSEKQQAYFVSVSLGA